jgi:hypothetical protein
MPLTAAPLVNVSRSPSTRRRGGSNPAPIVPGVDSTPTAFTFTDVTNAGLSTVYESNTITVTGIDAPAAMTITGGQYSVNGGAYASGPTTVFNGDSVKVRTTSSGSNSAGVDVTLTIGGVSDTYTVTTAAGAGAFSFTPFAYYDKTSVIQSGGAVSQWTDKGPNGVHLTQPIGASQPTWAANTITFDGVNDYLISANVDLSAKTALCLYARVTTKTGIVQHSGVVVIASPDGDYQGRGALIWSSQPVNLLQTYRDAVLLNTTVVPDIPIRLGVELNLSGAADTVYDFDTPTSNTAALTNTAFGSAVRFLLGGRLTADPNGVPGFYANYSIDGLVIIDFIPTAPQRDEIKAWLGAPAALLAVLRDESGNPLVDEAGNRLTG